MGLHFIDTDELVSTNCRALYLHSREAFRDIEKEVIAALVDFQNCVIATGGGTILDRDNVAILKKLGKIYYLRVPKEELKKRMLYSRRVETLNLASAKAPGLDDCKSMHIANMDRLTIVQSRELSHGPNSTFQPDGSIVDPLPAFLNPADPEGSFEQMYQERIGIYESIADHIVNSEEELLHTLAKSSLLD